MIDTKIVFRDGSEMIVYDCYTYKVDKSNKLFTIEKNGSNLFFNFNEIRCVGVAEELISIPRGEKDAT